jgi:hypothetical protein
MRIVAAMAAGLGLTLALAGCGSSGTSSLFSTSPLDMFKSSPKVTTGGDGGTASAAAQVDTDYDCPEVRVRTGAATLLIGAGAGGGEPNALDVRYQGSITRTARECHLNGGVMSIKVGIEGRIVTGPAGGAGTVDVPIRIAVVHEGVDPKPVASKLGRETVTLTGAVDRANFTHIESDISFPLPAPITDISDYVVYVGFDPQGAQPQKKPPAKKPKARPGTKPRSS